MSDAQREALREGELVLIATSMGDRPGEYTLIARNPAGDRVLIEEDGTVHPYADGRSNTVRMTPATLPPAA